MSLPPKIWCLFIVWGMSACLWGVLVNTTLAETVVPTTITSQSMVSKNKEGKATFEGAVVFTQGDLVIHSDVMIVFFKQEAVPDESNTSSQRKIEIVEAKGQVRIKKGEGKATCQHAVYYKDEEKAVLTGSPVAWQKGTRVSGPRMTLYLEEDRSVVEGGSRVSIINEEGEE